MISCDRCGSDKPNATIMSKFNTDIICDDCKSDEERAPNFKKADEAEIAAVRRGELNFPGIGLTVEDAAFLSNALLTRKLENV